MKTQIGHVVDVRLGGTERKRLPVFRPVDRTDFQLRSDTPSSRADCPQTRPCPFYKCEHNAWTVTGQDRPGRRWVDGDLPPTEVRPTIDQNCIADYAEHAERTGEPIEAWVVAAVLGVTERQVRRYAAHGLAVLAENPEANRELAETIAARMREGKR